MPSSIPNLPAKLLGTPGVEMMMPPTSILPSVTRMVTDAVSNLGTNENGLFTVWINTTAGVNLAHVQRVGGHAEVVSYVGKSWGEPIEAGIAARIHW